MPDTGAPVQHADRQLCMPSTSHQGHDWEEQKRDADHVPSGGHPERAGCEANSDHGAQRAASQGSSSTLRVARRLSEPPDAGSEWYERDQGE